MAGMGAAPTGDKKSGQVLVRTLGGKNPSQMRLGRRFRTTISRWQSRGCERHRRAIEKADRFWFAPWEAKTQARCGRSVSSASDFRRQVQRLWPEDTATIQKEMASPASSFT